MLKEEYTLDSFVVGNNKFLFSVVKEVIKNPGKIYSPLFIYGGTGDGKTHLLYAIKNEIMKNYSELRVEYMTIEKMVAKVKLSMKENRLEQFKNQMRNIDVLLLDDFQFIIVNEKIQEIVSEIIYEMISCNKQVVIASDVVLEELGIFKEKFNDCLGRGLKVEILKADYNSRLEILKTKNEKKNFGIDEKFLVYIANNFKGNNGSIIGLLNHVVSLANLPKLPVKIDYSFIDKEIQLFREKEEKKDFINKIVSEVARYFGVRAEAIFKPLKNEKMELYARNVAIYLCVNNKSINVFDIAEMFGYGMEHYLVVDIWCEMEKKINNKDENGKKLKMVVEKIGKRIKNLE